jgi:hypothetical protein
MVNGGGPQTTAHQCAWVTAGIDCTVHSGASYMIAAGWQPIDLSVLTVYAAVKWTGTNVLAGYAPIISDNYNTPHFYLTGQDSGLPFPRLRFNNLLAYAYGANLNDGNWHIFAGEYDGANISLYLDGAQLAFYNVGSSNPIQFSQLFLSNFANAAFWPGQIGYAVLYSVAHSQATIGANTATIRNIMSQRGVAIPALPNLLVFDVSAGIKRHHSGRFWCCQKRRRSPAGTRRRQPPESPAAVCPRFFPAGIVRPWTVLPRRQHEQELWDNDRAWCLA